MKARTAEATIAPARGCALGLMIVASAGALLATSDPAKQTLYSFQKSSDGQHTTLSASTSHARYLVRASVTALGTEQIDTTNSASATVQGTITSDGDAGASASASASPFVHVSFGASTQSSDEVSARTSFQLSRQLRFTGNCAQPDQGTPCKTELELDLDLIQPDALPIDGNVSIDWAVDFESRTFEVKSGAPDVESEAPWTIEIVELTEP
ncbi:MAG: hypothetical protein WDO69_23045 [Pseudomonadota bacterium]